MISTQKVKLFACEIGSQVLFIFLKKIAIPLSVIYLCLCIHTHMLIYVYIHTYVCLCVITHIS